MSKNLHLVERFGATIFQRRNYHRSEACAEEARASPSNVPVNEPDVIVLFGQSDEPHFRVI